MGGREGQGASARLCWLRARPGGAGSQPSLVPAPRPVPPEAETPQSSRPVSPTLPPPLPTPQANRFPCSREKRGSFQSCSELDAFPRASWSVSRQLGLGWEPHAACPPTPILHSGSHHRTEAPVWPFCRGLLGLPQPQPPVSSLWGSPSWAPSSLITETHVQPLLPSSNTSPSLHPGPRVYSCNTHTHTHTHACMHSCTKPTVECYPASEQC